LEAPNLDFTWLHIYFQVIIEFWFPCYYQPLYLRTWIHAKSCFQPKSLSNSYFMNELDKIFSQSKNAGAFAKGYLSYLNEVLSGFSIKDVSAFIQILLETRECNAQIFFMGNGGSAATASHFVNDLVIGTRSWNNPFRAISLTDNQAIVTAISNDDGYENIFTQQLQALLKKGDVVVAISASGNSINLLNAIEYANNNGATTVGITSFDGGQLRQMAKLGVHIPANKGDYGPAEDAHMVLNHLIGAYLTRLVADER
jgi:D-sedoheptulose 7-phosphate isomerase